MYSTGIDCFEATEGLQLFDESHTILGTFYPSCVPAS
jgi:hypothetical protein